MKKLLILLFIVSSVAASAQIKISQFPAYTGYCDTCYVPILKNGVNYKMRGKNLIVAVDSMYQTGEIIYYRMGGVWKQLSSSFESQWGLITGDISLQNDLMLRLNAKENVIPAGTYNDYIRGNKTIGNFATDLYALGDVRYALIGSSITVDSTKFATRARLYKVIDSIGGAAANNLSFTNGVYKLGNEVKAQYYASIWNANRIQSMLVSPVICNGCVPYLDSANQIIRWRLPDSAILTPIVNQINQRIDSLGIYAKYPLMGSKGATVNIKDTAFIDPNKVARWDSAANFAQNFSETVGVTHEELRDSTNNLHIAIASALANYYTAAQSDIRFVKYSDTAGMLNNYRSQIIANTIAIAGKVAYTDTAAMLNSYVRSPDVRSFTATDTTRWGAATAPAADNPFRIDSARVTGTTNKTITNYYHNGTTYSYGFVDLTAGNGGTVTGGTITWPGAIFNTPTTGTVSSGILNLSPTLATQPAGKVFASDPSVSSTPFFRSLTLGDISGSSQQIPFVQNGKLMGIDSLQYIRSLQSMLQTGNRDGNVLYAMRNYSAGGNATTGLSVANDIASTGTFSIGSSGATDLRWRNRTFLTSQTGYTFFSYNTTGFNVPSYADYKFYIGLTSNPTYPAFWIRSNGQVLINGSDSATLTNPNTKLSVNGSMRIDTVFANVVVSSAGVTGSGVGGTGTADGNNFPTNISASGNTISLDRSGLSTLSTSLDTATVFGTKAWTKKALDSTKAVISTRTGWINVKDYGAVGDGTTNDQAAIAAAIAAAATGQTVYFPAAVNGYFLASTVTINKTISLLGEPFSRIKVTGNISAFTFGANNIKIDKLAFIGSGKAGANTSQIGINCNSFYYFAIRDCEFYNFNGIGIYWLNTNVGSSRFGGRISDCYFNGNNIGFQSGASGEFVTITGGTAQGNNTGGIINGGNVNITGMQLFDNGVGLEWQAGTNNGHGSITGCAINHSTTYAIKMADNALGIAFNGCQIFDGKIWLKNTDGVLFSGCEIAATSMDFENSKNTNLIGNTFYAGYGFTLNNNFNTTTSSTYYTSNVKLGGTGGLISGSNLTALP